MKADFVKVTRDFISVRIGNLEFVFRRVIKEGGDELIEECLKETLGRLEKKK